MCTRNRMRDYGRGVIGTWDVNVHVAATPDLVLAHLDLFLGGYEMRKDFPPPAVIKDYQCHLSFGSNGSMPFKFWKQWKLHGLLPTPKSFEPCQSFLVLEELKTRINANMLAIIPVISSLLQTCWPLSQYKMAFLFLAILLKFSCSC